MGKNTSISWATDTFNSVWGCEKVSPACDHCYAETFAKRIGLDIWGKDKPRRFFGEKHWNEPRKWNAEAVRTGVRRRIFVNSMSDTFENRRDLDPVREQLWELIEELTYCDFLLLTKRPELMVQLTPKRWIGGWPANAWALTTAENQRRLDERLPSLLCVPARVRGLSIEPMLGPIVIPELCLPAIQWVIVGGESGHGARRMDPEWARALLAQCRGADVAYHFKQKGEVLSRELGCKDKAGKNPAEWPAEFRVQEVPVPV